MVFEAVAHVADVELATGRQQGFEEEIAIVMAAGTITGAGIVGHQVKTGVGFPPGESAVVHPQQTNHRKRDGSHR